MSEMSVRAVGWRIIVEPIPISCESEGGIALPTETIKAMEYLRNVGTVVDVGPLAYLKDAFKHHEKAAPEPWCKIGDTVAFAKYSGQDIVSTVDGESTALKILNDDDIMCVVTNLSALKPIM